MRILAQGRNNVGRFRGRCYCCGSLLEAEPGEVQAVLFDPSDRPVKAVAPCPECKANPVFFYLRAHRNGEHHQDPREHDMQPAKQLDERVHEIVCRDTPSSIGIPAHAVIGEPRYPPYSTQPACIMEMLAWCIADGREFFLSYEHAADEWEARVVLPDDTRLAIGKSKNPLEAIARAIVAT